MGERSLSSVGCVLDTNLICDLMRLAEWPWVQQSYGPLFVAQPVWDEELDDDFRERLGEFVTVVNLTEEEWTTVGDLRTRHGGGLSSRDRATIAVAIHRESRCGSNDKPVWRVCQAEGVPTLRTLGVLLDANRGKIKTKKECLDLVERLRQESTMRITPRIQEEWARKLR